MNAVADTLYVVSVFREYGVAVTFEPGWDTRGNGMTADYLGGVVHHTGTPSSPSNPRPTTRILRDGRSDLSGPLANFQGCVGKWVHVIAAHPANHAGAGNGYAMGPLPRTRLFNRLTMGLEIDYAGSVPMHPDQYYTAQVFTIAISMLRNRPNMEWTRLHAETSETGKWDPGYAPGKTISGNALRLDALYLEHLHISPKSNAQQFQLLNG